MGGDSKFLTVEDETDVLLFPSTLIDHGNLGLMNRFSSTSGVAQGEFGFHYTLNPNIVIAMYGGNLQSFRYGGLGIAEKAPIQDVAAEGSFDSELHEQANFFGAFGLGYRLGDLKLGTMIRIFRERTTVDYGLSKSAWGPMSLKLDLGGSLQLGSVVLDTALGFQMGFLTSEPQGEADLEGTGHTGIDFRARAFIPAAPGVTLIPYSAIYYVSESLSVLNPTDGPVERKYEGYFFSADVGADLKIEPVRDVFVYPGFGLRYQTNIVHEQIVDNVTSTTNTSIALPYFSMAIDARVMKWLDWRLGAVQLNLINKTSTDGIVFDTQQASFASANTGQSNTVSEIRFTTGFGINMGDWTVDVNIDPSFFTDGPYVMTGQRTPWALDASLRYVW
ncbi:MAG: hypothetical protein CMH54_07145 [Myxococcales bacterium]|nr:hypothetical protein [Myxococcales bacterium]